MPNTIEREKIRKERLGSHNYAVPYISWLPDVSDIIRTIKRPSYFHFDLKKAFIMPVVEADITIEVQNLKLKLPNALKTLADEIEKSTYLLDLEEDWDDEGGLPIEFETWKRAISLLVDYAKWLYNNQQYFVIELPQINPGPDTSIDLLWRNEKYRLLVNISENSEMPIEYYGDNNYGENGIKGNLKTDSIQEFFALWLKNLKK